MKYLVVLLVVVAVLWLIGMPRRRLDRQAGPSDPGDRAAPQPPTLPDSIVACPQCGLHLPLAEAVPGRGGYFCCETHRAVHERAHPGT